MSSRTIRRLLLAAAANIAVASAALYNLLAVLTPYRVAVFCGLFLSTVCFGFIARVPYRLRDPIRERNLAIGVLLAVVFWATSVIVLKIGLSVFRPAITYRSARHVPERVPEE